MLILFKILINDLFCFIENVSTHNIPDDDTLSAWARILSDVIKLLESENDIALNCLTSNVY